MKIVSIRAVEVSGLRRLRDVANADGSGGQSWIRHGRVASPMGHYRRFATDRSSWTPDWLPVGCVIEAEDGTWGLGLTDHGPPVAAIIDDYLASRLVGEEVMATEKVYDMAVRLCTPFGASGLASGAIGAIDLALWDLKGKLLGRPVYELLGGPARDKVACYATGADVDWYRQIGFRAIKLPCPWGPSAGRAGLRDNVEAVAQVRELVGDDVELMLDCWMAFDVESAVQLAEAVRPFGLRWIEECLPPDDLVGHAKLRARVPWQRLAGGEHWPAPATFAHAIGNDVLDVIQPDIQWVGGLTALAKICAVAEAAGVTVIPHAGGATPYGQHACYALPAIEWAEVIVATPPGMGLCGKYGLASTPTPVDGWLQPTDAPGFGLAIEAAQLEPFASGHRKGTADRSAIDWGRP